MENPLNLTKEEYDRLYREETIKFMKRNPSKKSNYYDGEFGPIDELPSFIRSIFTDLYVSDEAKDEFKKQIVYKCINDSDYCNSLSGIIVFLDGHFHGIFDIEYALSLTPSYDGGLKLFQIGCGGYL